ncbi:MAG: iron-sulfur cluster insertion protein ErpA [Rhodospirillaceae bacterium]|nr:iron-sulfur cluster insertion protein ErpA [Rhodospirillaceae bacterium]|tara:strand:- start:155 stop:508 length:354 start_codon:yes stop_codon:yes gene_type:complete
MKPLSAVDYGLSMTDGAASRINRIVEEEGLPGLALRVSVSGGGCSGFQYGFTLDDARNADDLSLEHDGATIVVDEMSLSLLQGSQIDWQESLEGATFVVKNPNATASCGCGTSFSIG